MVAIGVTAGLTITFPAGGKAVITARVTARVTAVVKHG